MLIGYDASRAFVRERTGTENYSYFLLKEMLNCDRTNAYRIFLRPPAEAKEKKEFNEWLSWVKSSLPKTNNYTINVIKQRRLWTQWGLARALQKKKVDVLFVPAHTLPIFRPKKIKTVVTIHDLGYEYLPQYHQFPHSLWLTYFTEYAAHNADRVIAVSEATKEDIIEKFSVPQMKIQIVHEGFVPQQNSNQKNKIQILNKYGIENVPFLLCVGTVQPRKNLERLIEAFAQILKSEKESKIAADTQLVLAGKKGWMSDAIYSAPARFGVENNVKFLGYVPDEDVHDLLTSSKGLLFPSLFEGFGLPIIEAQSAGVPVLTSDKKPMTEVAGNAALYVDPISVDSIADGILQILTDDTRRKYLISHGKENVKRFSWKNAARETIHILEDAVRG